MLTIKLSKEILKDMLGECEKTGESYSDLEINPITLYQKNDDGFNPVVGIALSDSGEISTKIRAKYREEDAEETDSDSEENKEESVLKKICKSNRFYRLHAERACEILKKKDPSQVGMTEIIIAKHRNGSVCDVPMRFRHSEVRFVDVTDAALDMPAGGGAGEYESRMNSSGDLPDPFAGANDEFGNNSDF